MTQQQRQRVHHSNSLRLPIYNLSNSLHLLQMFPRMIRMNHIILNSNIIPTKELDNLSSRMDKVSNVINCAVDDDLVALERFEGSDGLGGGVVVVGRGTCFGGDAVADAGDIGVGGHRIGGVDYELYRVKCEGSVLFVFFAEAT